MCHTLADRSIVGTCIGVVREESVIIRVKKNDWLRSKECEHVERSKVR